jgi:hypothetical protein
MIRTLIPSLAFLAFAQAAEAGQPRGIGVIGDSYSDEYASYPPDRASARNWVEILARQGWNFGAYSEESRNEPRNAGYAYNWARSDAESTDALASGQHTGLAEQMRSGEVELAVVFVGGNDFIHALMRRDPASSLESLRSQTFANLETIVDTLLQVNPEIRVVVGTIPDIGQLPEFADDLEAGRLDPALLDAYRQALRQHNASIRALAHKSPRLALVDFDTVIRLATLTRSERVNLFGHWADRTRCGNSPDHVFLADRRHIGTLTQATMARLVATAANTRFGFDLPMPSDREILDLAGLPRRDNKIGLVSSSAGATAVDAATINP